MIARARRQPPRGMTLIEVMVALTVLLVALLGFVATIQFAASSTGAAHRHTMTTFLRASLIDRLTVTSRAALVNLPAAWGVIDTCYDENGQELGDNYSAAPVYDPAFTCPAGTFYRSYVRSTPNAAFVNWTVSLYVERVDMACTSASDPTQNWRDAAIGCSNADLLLTN